jgi:hypothetical protein
MPSIADLRSALGAFANDKSDEQLLQLASTAAGVSPGRIASEYGYKPTESGIAGLRTGAAIDRYQAGLYGLGEAVTGADFFRRGREANEFEANVALERARDQGAIGSFEEVQGFSDVPSYVGGLAIGSAPYMVEALGGGLAARGLMSGTRAALGTARAAGDVGAAAQATRALRAGQTVGGVAAGYPSAVGDILQAQREQADGQIDLGAAAALGVPYSALNALGIEGALARQQGIRSGITALDNIQGLRGGLARAGASGVRTAGIEGGTETLQEMTSQLGRMAVDPNEAFLSDAALGRYKESAIGGALLGGTIGGATGFGRSEGYRAPMQERDLTQPDTGTEQKPVLGLQYNPLAGTPIIFPDGTVALGSEQEMLARTGIKMPAAGETDLTAPAATTAAGETKPTVPSIFSELDTTLNKLGIKPTKNSRGIYEYMVAEGIDPASPEAEPVLNALANSKLGEARKAVGEIIRARSPRGTGVSTVQQPAGGLGVGSPVVQGTVGDAGRAAPVAGTVVGSAPAAGAPLQQTGLLPSTAGQPSTPVTTTAPTAAPAPDTRFRRAPRPMTVLEAANAAKAAQAQQAETQGQETPATAGPVVDPRQVTLQQIFGQRNGDIIFDVVGMGMPEPEAATKYGLSRQAIQKIAGATGQKTWPERIARAKTEFGLTDAKIAEAFNVVPQEELGTEVEREVFGRGQAAGAITETEAIEGGLENIVKTAGAGTAEVEGFTKLDNDVMTVLERIASLRDAVSKANSEAEQAELKTKLQAAQDNLADLTEKAKAVGKRKQAEVRRDAGKVTAEGEPDAVQVESTAGVPVQPKAEAGKEVGRQVRRAPKPAAEGKTQVPAVVLTEAEQAAQAWDVVAADFPQAPKFAELTKAQQQDFIEFGPGNWERGDVELELTKLARGGMKFGKEGAPAAVKQPYTVKQLLAELKDFIRADIPKRKLFVVESVADLLTSPDENIRAVGAALQLQGAYGVAVDGRAYLIANRIKQGSGRAKFMHEVGGHLGLDKLLTKADQDKLVNQIKTWAKKADGSLEAEIALQAFERVQAAGTPKEDQRSELIAYFIESAMEMGVDPTAATDTKLSGPLREWFRSLWAAFKVAARKLGIKPESMTAQDVVNLAYGAARLEINGTWHGTAASFRNFRNKFIGSGEGATAYGWGTYLAQRIGIAKGYFKADVDRKTGSPTATYDGRPIEPLMAELDAKKDGDSGLTDDERSLYLVLMELGTNLSFGDSNALRTANMNIAKRGASGSFTSKTYKQASDWLDKNYSKFKVTPGKKPEGNLMRVDTAVDSRNVYNYDRPISKQPDNVRTALEKALEPLAEEIVDRTNKDVQDLTGRDLIGTGENDLGLLSKLIMDDAISPSKTDAAFEDAVRRGKFHEAASHYLRTLGVEGLQFYDAQSRGSATDAISFEGKRYNRDELRDLSREASTSGDENKKRTFMLLRSILRNGFDNVKAEFEDKIAGQAERLEEIYLESAARYGVKVDPAAERARAQKEAADSFEGKQLAWLNANESKISLVQNPKTRNIVIFDDKDIQRVGSEAAADRQRMKFGSDMVELGKRGQLKGKAGTTRVDTANDRAIKLLDKADKTKDPAEAAALRAEANALFSATAGKLTGMKFGKNMPSQGLIARNIAKLPKQAQQPVRNTVGALSDLAGKGLDYVVFTSDLVNRAVAAGMPSAQKFADVLARRAARVSELEREIEKIADGYADIEPEFKGSGRGSVNDFLFESTRTGKWGYGKFRDAKMGAEFDKLGPKAQKFVKDVFAHGDKALSDKKKIVLDAATSEYDAMIKAAQDANDTKAEASLKAEKAASLKRFQTLFRIREGLPYAPIKRNGTQVVIGKSDEYKAAVAAKDTKRVKQLESDPDHYHVSFVDSKWEARTLKDKLEEQGVFTELDIVTRSQAFEEAFSGEALLPALTKMRAAVDKRATDTNGKKDPTAGKMLNIINQLYLEALAEGSARKSEMRRRGVAGEVDMLQSFTQQGRADANFMANVQFEPLVQDQLQNMRNESRSGDRERKSEIFNELTQRYAGSLDVKVNSWVNGLTNMASKFFLASSPAYYLQNLTQPFMMSLPAMAGRHDYTKAAAEMAKAYTELGPLFKDVKLFDQQFDFSKVPADVRTAINELVNQGKIDIGLATEINEYKVDADGKLSQFAQRLNKGMRMAVQKVEAVNRLSTAIAAYRLEYAKTKDAAKATQYAADILSETHGDYTALNAPRAFNSQLGKVALQFRKFQLIQITFYAKLIRDAFTKPDERAAAMKTLAYSLGHTGVFAGLMGLPGYAAISAILGAFGDEDEPYDLTAEMRKALGPEWADMIMRGAPTIVGMDLSGKIGAGNMLSIMPFSDADLSTTAGQAEALGTLLGGAVLGMTSRVADGLILMSKGDYYKGLERVMPKGVSDALKAGRQATEGMTRRNGDVVLPESEIGAVETVLTGLGVPSVQQSVTYERQNRMRDLTKNFQDRTTRIKNDYAQAVRQKDTAAMQDAREAWTKLQQARQRNGLTPQPVSNLLKAPQEQAQREKRTVGGVQYREGQRKLAESVAEN